MRKIRTPFFIVNPKAYLHGASSLELAKHADALAEKYDVDILFTGQHVDLRLLKSECPHLIITAQHMDGMKPGRGMGHILPDALKEAGVEAVFLNHAEHALTFSQLAAAIRCGKEQGIASIVCADSVEEAGVLAQLHPEIMVCEQTSLIGTGKTADESYMETTNRVVKTASPETLVLQAAGISSGKNVYDAIMSGADGTGGTSGIVCAPDPKAMLTEMIEALCRAREDRK